MERNRDTERSSHGRRQRWLRHDHRVAPNTNSVATITASRFAYTDQSSTTNGTSLLARLDPNLINVTRTATGYTADIQNYDPLYNWEASVLPGTGSALIAHVGNIYQLQVTVPGANTPATATVATTRTGYAPGSATLTESSLMTARTPEFGEGITRRLQGSLRRSRTSIRPTPGTPLCLAMRQTAPG